MITYWAPIFQIEPNKNPKQKSTDLFTLMQKISHTYGHYMQLIASIAMKVIATCTAQPIILGNHCNWHNPMQVAITAHGRFPKCTKVNHPKCTKVKQWFDHYFSWTVKHRRLLGAWLNTWHTRCGGTSFTFPAA